MCLKVERVRIKESVLVEEAESSRCVVLVLV